MEVLVTGATGVVGSALLRQLLSRPRTRINVLVRGDSQPHAERRAAETLAELEKHTSSHPTPFPSDASERVSVFLGDVSRPRLGLDPGAHVTLAGRISHIVHAAASVKMNMSLETARATCLYPVEQVLALADACAAQGRPLQRLVFVSTVGVVGNVTGTAAEVPFRMARTFRNTYEQTKAEAEEMVLDRIAGGLPAVLLRPTMVVGDSHSGWARRIQVFHTLCEMVSGRLTEGIVPARVPLTLDLVPSDYVARAIAISLEAPEAVGRIFHACAGPSRNLTLFDDLGPAVRALLAERGWNLPPLRPLALADYEQALLRLARAPERAQANFARAALHIIPYLDKTHLFDNHQAEQVFGKYGLATLEPGRFLRQVLAWQCPEPQR
jgi:thioester reductase-like protein